MAADRTNTRDRALEELEAWVEQVDADLAEEDMPLPDRPFRTLIRLLANEVLAVHVGDETVDFDLSGGQLSEPWFHALYRTVKDWYVGVYGAEAIRAKGVAELIGVVMVRGAPFRLEVPALRNKVEIEGLQAWMFFEEAVGEGEDPLIWLRNGPNLKALDAARRAEALASATEVAGKLRFLHFRRSGLAQKPEAMALAHTVRENLERAARLIATAKGRELGPAWFDLQMAMESALKLVLQAQAGAYPHTHKLTDLLRDAAVHGVVFDPSRLATWPDFKTMSGYRYTQGDPGSVAEAFQTYRLTLDLAAACMATITPPIPAGAGVLVQRPPWLRETTDETAGSIEFLPDAT